MSAALKTTPVCAAKPTARLVGPEGPMTVEEYLASEELSPVKREYVNGYAYPVHGYELVTDGEAGVPEVWAMAGARNVHNTVATAFYGMMYARLRGKPCQPFNSDARVRVRRDAGMKYYYPDAMVVCEPNPPDDTHQDRPTVIAEVLSPSTRRVDEGEKREAYQTIDTVRAYLLIETDRPRVVVHRRTDDGFAVEEYDGTDAVIPLAELGTTLPLAELYERVDFDAAAENAADAGPAGT